MSLIGHLLTYGWLSYLKTDDGLITKLYMLIGINVLLPVIFVVVLNVEPTGFNVVAMFLTTQVILTLIAHLAEWVGYWMYGNDKAIKFTKADLDYMIGKSDMYSFLRVVAGSCNKDTGADDEEGKNVCWVVTTFVVVLTDILVSFIISLLLSEWFGISMWITYFSTFFILPSVVLRISRIDRKNLIARYGAWMDSLNK